MVLIQIKSAHLHLCIACFKHCVIIKILHRCRCSHLIITKTDQNRVNDKFPTFRMGALILFFRHIARNMEISSRREESSEKVPEFSF